MNYVTSLTLSTQVLRHKSYTVYTSLTSQVLHCLHKSYVTSLTLSPYLQDVWQRKQRLHVTSARQRDSWEYLRLCGYVGTLVQSDRDLLREIRSGAFQHKTCVIVDDSYNLECTKLSLKKLFKLLKDNGTMSLFAFADKD